jgi:MFS family permease
VARTSVAAAFVLNGFCFASLFARVPDLRSGLSLDNAGLGLLLLSSSAASVLALPASGRLIERFGAAAVVRGGALLVALGLVLAGLGAGLWTSAPIAAVGLFVYGLGTSVWDVAMNVEGAAVEQQLGRTVMPRFHAGWSMGSIGGAAVGVPVNALGVPLGVHLGAAGLVALTGVLVAVRRFLSVEPPAVDAAPEAGRSAWLEPQTLAIGAMVLAFALTEGSANDWLALALIDGHHVEQWMGVAGYALFVTAMTTGRLLGTGLLDRHGRVPVLRGTAAAALAGLLLVVFGGPAVVVVAGILLWGLGASLGFPVGMSAGADDPLRAARRVSVVSTIGYGAFLAGPPLLGFLGDHVGTLEALLAVAVLLVPSTLLIPAAREPSRPVGVSRARRPAPRGRPRWRGWRGGRG